MRKSVLSLSVTAALAIPAISVAQQAAPAAPAVPTLDKVLEASGLAVSGYIDTAYARANRNIEAGIMTPGTATTPPTPTFATPPRVFDNQNNSFALHQFALQVAKQPKEGVGGLVNITTGKDAGVIHSFPANEATFDITQGFLQYASGPFTVMAGKFTTLHGTEVIWSPTNVNFSRSILFGAVPFTHTGVRVSYAPLDTVTLYGGLNNGWDELTDPNKGKTAELGATFTPIKPLSITASSYLGQEPTGFNQNGSRKSFNLVASYTVIEPLSLGIEYLRVDQKNFSSIASPGTSIDAKYSGFAGYVTYMLTPKWRAAVRLESFKDDDGFHFGVPNTKYKEETLTISHLMSDSFELRGEIRHDSADKPVYADFTGLPAVGSSTSKSVTTFAFQALYKF